MISSTRKGNSGILKSNLDFTASFPPNNLDSYT